MPTCGKTSKLCANKSTGSSEAKPANRRWRQHHARPHLGQSRITSISSFRRRVGCGGADARETPHHGSSSSRLGQPLLRRSAPSAKLFVCFFIFLFFWE